jgi:hypothetical protein
MPMNVEDYLASADMALSQGRPIRDSGQASVRVAEAQVAATQAIAVAIDRLARAFEALSPHR